MNTDLPFAFNPEQWAQEFVEFAKNTPTMAMDVASMRGWFANAIMSGYDEANRRTAHRILLLEFEVRRLERQIAKTKPKNKKRWTRN